MSREASFDKLSLKYIGRAKNAKDWAEDFAGGNYGNNQKAYFVEAYPLF